MPNHSMAALVTGAGSFTGPYLSAALQQQGIDVYSLTQPNKEPVNSDKQFACDINDLDTLVTILNKIKPNYIIHLAGITHVQHTSVIDFYNVNVLGTETLLNAIVSAKVEPKKVLIASSANVYGNCTAEQVTEDMVPQPVNHYACSKLAMEHTVKNWFQRMPIIISRPFNYTGIGQSSSFIIPKIVEHFKAQKKVIELGNIDVIRDYSDVRTVAAAYVKLLLSDADSECVNICSSQGYSLREIISNLESLAGYNIELQQNPLFMRKNELHKLIGSNQKLHKLIGNIENYSIQETLAWMFAANDSPLITSEKIGLIKNAG